MKLRTVSFSHLDHSKLIGVVMFWPFIRHAHPIENLESRARAPRAGAGGTTGRHKGWCLLLQLRHPRETEKSSSVEEEDTLPSIEAAAMKRRSWVIDMKRLKTGLQQVVRGL